MALPTGTWTINGNGYTGQLSIQSVDAQGNLTGAVFGQKIVGFWDEASQRISFIRVIDAGRPDRQQVYTGYLFPMAQGTPAAGEVLAGSFEAFQGTGANARHSVFGWFAQHS